MAEFDKIVDDSSPGVAVTDSGSTGFTYGRFGGDAVLVSDFASGFPPTWPPGPPTGVRSIRVYITGTTTSNFVDSAYMFIDQVSANTFTPLPVIAPGSTANVVVPINPWGGGRNPGNPDPTFGSPPPPLAQIWCRGLVVHNTGGHDLVFSFDGNNIHGLVPANTTSIYYDRFESGISVQGSGGNTTFIIEAW